MTMTSKPLLTLAEAAELLGLAASTLRRQAILGRLRAERHETPRGPVWLTTHEAVEEYRRDYAGRAGQYPRQRRGTT